MYPNGLSQGPSSLASPAFGTVAGFPLLLKNSTTLMSPPEIVERLPENVTGLISDQVRMQGEKGHASHGDVIRKIV